MAIPRPVMILFLVNCLCEFLCAVSCVQRKTTKGTPIAERQRSTACSCEGPTARERTRRRIRPAAQATGNLRTKSEGKTTRRVFALLHILRQLYFVTILNIVQTCSIVSCDFVPAKLSVFLVGTPVRWCNHLGEQG